MRSCMTVCVTTGFVVGLTITSAAQLAGDGLLQKQQAQTAAPAGVIGGTCAPNKITYKTSDVSVNIDTSTYATVPNTSVNFTQGGSSASCVIVRYSGMASATEPRWIPLRIVLNGRTVAEPGDVQFEGHTQGISLVRSFDFVFPSVQPGKHNIRAEWRSFNTGIVFMHRRTIVVQHR